MMPQATEDVNGASHVHLSLRGNELLYLEVQG